MTDAEMLKEQADYLRSEAATADDASREAMLEDAERLESLAARLPELERDTARYRWLRTQPNDTNIPQIDVVLWEQIDDSANGGNGMRLEELDSAIDAAMQEQPK